MHGPNDKVEVIAIHGPFAGQPQTYLRHAAEAAVTNGFARWPDESETEAETGTGTNIPAAFPAREKLVAAGFAMLEEVPREKADLQAISGIGRKTAADILEALGA